MVKPPFVDREDLRFLLNNCTGLLATDGCAMSVVGVVKKPSFGNNPELAEVDFLIPSQ
jgi:hypothetical protein